MSVRGFALLFGIVFLVVGIAGFIPGLVHAPAADHPDIAMDANYGRLLGLFPVNLLHNLVHILFGLWGLAASRSIGGSRSYARVVAIAYGALVILGLIPGLNTLFGLVPIFGNDVWLHLLLAAVAAYFGWAHRSATDVSPV